MHLTVTSTTPAQRLDELDGAIRRLTTLAESTGPAHRNYLTLEAIALDDELWRLQRRRTAGVDVPALVSMIENLEADVDRLRSSLEELAPPATVHQHRVTAEPLAA